MMLGQLMRFSMVGGAGFLLDAALLQGLISLMGMDPFSARVFSFLGAATLTWALNRSYTFNMPQRDASAHGEWLRYTGLMVIGAIVNYATYAYCLTTFPIAARFPVLGVAAGSLAGLAINFATSRRLFSQTSTTKPLE